MIELHQLRCFVAVAEELHFGRAARRLFMTQPPLSRQIQLLEHALGIALLERSSRQVSLTAAGERFLRDARHILEFSARAEQAAQRVAHGGAGRITLGFTAVSAYRMIPMLLAHAAHALPDVDIELREMVSTVQIDALASRMLDAGFVRQRAARQPLEYRLVQREPMQVAVAEGAPLAACERIGPDDLDRQPFIAYSPNEGKYFHDLISGVFANAGRLPNYLHYVGQTHTILGLVRAGLGAALVPASARELHVDGVVFRPLAGADVAAELYLAWRTDNDNPALPVFNAMVERFLTENADEAGT
ncbi:LysR family transcriptional regulator [Burkholderia contaminans FFH2055]|uniref:LysR substrate-binding domain-containing protein n=1 Tax=Burkholderia contaminans TaxID=488447 RepID=UPI000625A65E|nr:LysR substrate-binding domain-containing protein [Burkholderia contaminans]KKL33808.1 LysR family transcriptional regulator [Burkholderia contaminans FFH2055]MEB4630254.1 LysR substrate-binding domain-containing protein [Burkholderia contaminans]MEB4641276.1 LysR substrate-binding domain-containing protein [Burkholderia contaminans]MEB4656261.1 LysR substrate-binding domain-containing protein [Burkholderia contaminans]MEB4660487.1 LysR substrate-binding domain-containing protein [Burkholder